MSCDAKKSKKMVASLGDFEVLCTIGTGSYGTCKKILRKKDQKVLVWKEMDYGEMSEVEKQMLVSEVNLLRELRHPNIVRYFDRIVERSKTKLFIIMEYCENGDLATLISRAKKEGRHMDEEFVWKIAYQLTSALKVCHSRNKDGKTVLHRDLKPANVFLDSDLNIKLGDFGLARVLSSETSFAQTFVGTPYYMSPEQMNHMSYNEKSDIWSLGCMLYETCALKPPFTAFNQRELATRISAGRFGRIPYRYSDELHDLISSMLVVNGSQRPSIDDLLKNNILLRKAGINGDDSISSNSSSKAELQMWQQKMEALALKESQMSIKEKELQALEESIKQREKLADEKLAKAERLMREYQFRMKAIEGVGKSPRDKVNLFETPPSENKLHGDLKKQVAFAGLNKENDTEPYSTPMRYNRHLEFDHAERIAKLRKRLEEARMKSEVLVGNSDSRPSPMLVMR